VAQTTVTTPPAHHRILYLLAAVAQGAGPLLTQPFVQRTLDAEQWGRVSFAISLVSVGLIVILAGLPLIITRVFYEGTSGSHKARSLSGFGIVQSAGLAVLAAAVVAAIAASSGRLTDDLSVVFALLSIGFLGAIQMSLAVIRAQHRAGVFVGITIGAQTIGHVAGLAAVLLISKTAAAYMGAFVVVVLLTGIWGLLAAGPARPFAFPQVIRNALATSMPILPHSIALVLMLQGESFILTTLHGPAFYGLYGAMLPMALGPVAVVMALGNVWETTILARRGEDTDGAVRRVQLESVLIGTALALAGSASAVFAAHILAKEPNPEQLQLARILPAMAMGYIVFLLATTQMVAVGRTRLMAVVTPVVAVADLAIMLIPATAGSLFWVGVTKIGFFAVLGLAHMAASRLYGSSLVDPKVMVGGLTASFTVCLAMLLVPTDYVTGLVTFGSVLVLLAGGALWMWRTGRLKAIVG
jgi:O-antigen/teichoic acid export membrane protein